MLAGSSPLARGTLMQIAFAHKRGRFIPAGAGNTRSAGWRDHPPAVHPRWRGEHGMTATITGSLGGSSPLARGTPQQYQAAVLPFRFIPAGAGNTPSNPANMATSPVHPRWRGEHCR